MERGDNLFGCLVCSWIGLTSISRCLSKNHVLKFCYHCSAILLHCSFFIPHCRNASAFYQPLHKTIIPGSNFGRSSIGVAEYGAGTYFVTYTNSFFRIAAFCHHEHDQFSYPCPGCNSLRESIEATVERKTYR